MDYQKATKKYYNDNAQVWAKSKGHSSDSFYKDELNIFFELAKEGSVLEIGIGDGKDAEELATKYNYTGIDISEGMVKFAKEKHKNLNFIQGNVTDLPFEDDAFNHFFTAATLLHITREDMPKALGEIKRVVMDEGIGFISLKKGKGEEFRAEENDRLFSYFTIEEFSKILQENGFEVLKTLEKLDGRPNKPNWIEFFVNVQKS